MKKFHMAGSVCLVIASLAACLLLSISTVGAKQDKQNNAAMITTLEGKAQMISGGKTTDASLMQILKEKDQIKIMNNSSVTLVFFKDRHTETIKGKAHIEITETFAKLIKGDVNSITALKADKKIAFAKTIKLTESAINTLVSRKTDFEKTDVKGEIKLYRSRTIATINPKFTWEQYPTADKYKFEIEDIFSQKKIFTSTVQENFISLASPNSLKWKGQYSWTVKAYKGDKFLAIASSIFRILSEEKAKEINQARKNFDELSKIQQGETYYYAPMIMLYLECELYDEALPLLEKLAELMPENAEAHEALAFVYEKLGRYEDALKEIKLLKI